MTRTRIAFCLGITGLLFATLRSGFAQHAHDPGSHAAAQPIVKKPRLFLDKSPRIVAYQLQRLSNAQLLLADRSTDDPIYRPVYEAILLRPGMARDDRNQALEALQTLDHASAVDALLAALEGLKLEDPDEAIVFDQLTTMLLAQPAESLRADLPRFQSAIDASTAGVRIAGYAALISAGRADEAWAHATAARATAGLSGSPPPVPSPGGGGSGWGDGQANRGTPAAGRLDFLAAVRHVPQDNVRAALRDKVARCLDDSQPFAVEQAALATLAHIPSAQQDSFRLAAAFVDNDKMRSTAVATLIAIPQDAWPADAVQPLLEALVRHVESIPAAERTRDEELDGLRLTETLLARLPVERARSFRERLRAVTVRVVAINTVPEEMRFDRAYFAVEAGRPVQVVVANKDAMPHNFVITQPGKLREVALAGAALGNTPGPDGKQYVPDSDQVLFATHLVSPGKQERLVFDAPTEPGEYPFVCTFPQHWTRMYGVMVVTEDLDAWLADPKEPADPLGNTRRVVKHWTLDDFPDVASGLRGRTSEIGRRLFEEATCLQCHKIGGEGGAVGPELTDVFNRWKGDSREVLHQILEPSYKVDPPYAMQTIVKADGTVLSGIITEQNAGSLTIVTNPESPKPQVVPRRDVDEIVKSTTSMMPKGLLDRFTQDEIFELIAYLKSFYAQP